MITELKGYWTSYGYYGQLDDGTYMEFASDTEYYEYMKGDKEE